jgi:hypothetical protein
VERREWVKWLAADVRIVVDTVGRPIERYAIRLELWDAASWRTVHLFDNAHGQHDSHRYPETRSWRPSRCRRERSRTLSRSRCAC